MKILNIALTVALSALIGTSFASTTVYKSVGKNWGSTFFTNAAQ